MKDMILVVLVAIIGIISIVVVGIFAMKVMINTVRFTSDKNNEEK